MITAIIRTTGERTTDLCRKLVKQQAKDVTVVEERPLSASLRRCFEIGIEKNRRWTLLVDADVLVRRGCIDVLIEAITPSDFCVEGKVLDRVFNAPRWGGAKLYRTDLLKEAIGFISNRTDRPETDVLRKMEKLGYPLIQIDEITGLHNYFQHYSDLRRAATSRKIRKYLPYL